MNRQLNAAARMPYECCPRIGLVVFGLVCQHRVGLAKVRIKTGNPTPSAYFFAPTRIHSPPRRSSSASSDSSFIPDTQHLSPCQTGSHPPLPSPPSQPEEQHGTKRSRAMGVVVRMDAISYLCRRSRTATGHPPGPQGKAPFRAHLSPPGGTLVPGCGQTCTTRQANLWRFPGQRTAPTDGPKPRARAGLRRQRH